LRLYGGSDLDLLRVTMARLVTIKGNTSRLLANADHLKSSINLHSTLLEILSLFVFPLCVSYHSQSVYQFFPLNSLNRLVSIMETVLSVRYELNFYAIFMNFRIQRDYISVWTRMINP